MENPRRKRDEKFSLSQLKSRPFWERFPQGANHAKQGRDGNKSAREKGAISVVLVCFGSYKSRFVSVVRQREFHTESVIQAISIIPSLAIKHEKNSNCESVLALVHSYINPCRSVVL